MSTLGGVVLAQPAAAGALVAAIWQGVLLVSLVALAMRAMPGLSAGTRGRMWMGVLGLLIVLPVVEMLLPARAAGSASGAVRVGEGWSVALVAAWAALAVARGLQLLASAVRLGRISRGARMVEVPEGVRGLLAGVEVCVSEEAGRPSVVGWRRPRILLPPEMLEGMTEGELRQVLLHEMEHVRRGDQWTNLAQKVALVVLPLSPAAIWVERRLCLERELACDDGVLQAMAGRKAYAACLARLAEHAVLRRGAMLALGAWERQSELGRRVTRLLRGPERGMSVRRRRAAVAMVAGGMVLGGAGLVEAPRLVSFGPAPSAAVAEAPVRELGGLVHGEGMVPVGMRMGGTAGGRMVLASARMSVGASPIVTRVSGPVRRFATPRFGRQVVARRMQPVGVRRVGLGARWPVQRWVVLTRVVDVRMRAEAPVGPVLTLAVGDGISPSYAAVPTGDGWLVVQL